MSGIGATSGAGAASPFGGQPIPANIEKDYDQLQVDLKAYEDDPTEAGAEKIGEDRTQLLDDVKNSTLPLPNKENITRFLNESLFPEIDNLISAKSDMITQDATIAEIEAIPVGERTIAQDAELQSALEERAEVQTTAQMSERNIGMGMDALKQLLGSS